MLSLSTAAEEMLQRRQSRAGLLPFCEYTHHDWQMGEHHKRICAALERVERGECKRLMIFAPPRHGKSELASRRFPAWYLGRNPDKQILATSYNADLATDFGREVRNIVRDEPYRHVFPGLELAQDSTAAGRWHTNKGGIYISTGVGGTLTGRGFHCIAAGSMVETIDGPVRIEDVRVGDLVLTHKMRWRKVMATANNGVQDVITLSGGGANLTCTNDHKLLTEAGWREAKRCRHIFRLDLPALRAIVSTQRALEESEVLRATMLKAGPIQAIDGAQATVQALWGDHKRRGPQVLLEHMQGQVDREDRGASNNPAEALSGMQEDVSAGKQVCDDLQPGMRGAGSLQEDAGPGQSEFQGRGLLGRPSEAIPKEDIAPDAGQDNKMHGVQRASEPSASHRRESTERCGSELGGLVQAVPCEVSQVQRCIQAPVYDIQVEEDGSFVCEGFIVHNCGIIDDPIKNREEADSQRVRDSVWKWYTSTFYTRAMPDASIIFMVTRWMEDDLAARALESEEWEVLSLPAIENEHTDHEKALWPDRYSLESLQHTRSVLPRRDWQALYQQQPTVETGTYCQRAWFADRYDDAPETLNKFVASDFAVTEGGEGADPDWTEHGVFGIAPDDTIYLVDWWSGQTTSDQWIESLLDLIAKHKPLGWFGEAGVIRRAIEPFLRKRMRERHTYVRTEWMSPIKAKDVRGRAFQARASMGKIRFPKTAWADRVIDQCVAFPGGAHDDAFDVMSLMCQAIDQAHPAIEHKQPARVKDRWRRERVPDQAWRVV